MSKKREQKVLVLEKIQSRSIELQLEEDLRKFFTDLGVWIQNRLHHYYNVNLNNGQLHLITDPILDKHQEYYEILEHWIRLQYALGKEEAESLLRLANEGYVFKAEKIRLDEKKDLWNYLPDAVTDLLDKVFVASRNTLQRVTDDLQNLIVDGYVNGAGIDEVSRSLTRRFDQLRTWEARRIARTETHNAHNNAVYNSYKKHDVQYTQWITVGDEKVRGHRKWDLADHVKLDGEIIRIGDTYSNGLRYPGDTDGPIEEWINCRCAQAPYTIPYGFAAPPKATRFFENELIKINVERRT